MALRATAAFGLLAATAAASGYYYQDLVTALPPGQRRMRSGRVVVSSPAPAKCDLVVFYTPKPSGRAWWPDWSENRGRIGEPANRGRKPPAGWVSKGYDGTHPSAGTKHDTEAWYTGPCRTVNEMKTYLTGVYQWHRAEKRLAGGGEFEIRPDPYKGNPHAPKAGTRNATTQKYRRRSERPAPSDVAFHFPDQTRHPRPAVKRFCDVFRFTPIKHVKTLAERTKNDRDWDEGKIGHTEWLKLRRDDVDELGSELADFIENDDLGVVFSAGAATHRWDRWPHRGRSYTMLEEHGHFRGGDAMGQFEEFLRVVPPLPTSCEQLETRMVEWLEVTEAAAAGYPRARKFVRAIRGF